jgi:hypothetical protein
MVQGVLHRLVEREGLGGRRPHGGQQQQDDDTHAS